MLCTLSDLVFNGTELKWSTTWKSKERNKDVAFDIQFWGLQNKEKGKKKHKFKNGGIREWGKQNKNEDQQNNGLEHLDEWNKKGGTREHCQIVSIKHLHIR